MSTQGTPTCLILGASHGGVQLAFSLRKEGWQGRIRLIEAQDTLPYHLPPLSKGYLSGDKDRSKNSLKGVSAYAGADIELCLNSRVAVINRSERYVQLTDETSLPYDKLAIATGAVARIPHIQGIGTHGVYTLRTYADADAIRKAALTARSAVILGGGYIGLEVAASLRQRGLSVTLIEMAPRILSRTSAHEVANFLTELHERHGVVIKTSARIDRINGSKWVTSVTTDTNEELPADLVVIGAGIAPNVILAEKAGLQIENGIRTDGACRTSDPDIVAIGDCASTYHASYAKRLRIESVQNAVETAMIAAKTICGKPAAYDALPWFWSHQYDAKLQIVGLAEGSDRTVVRAEGRCAMSVWYYKGPTLKAVDTINSTTTYVIAKEFLEMGISPSSRDVADPSVDLKTLLQQSRAA